MGECSGRLPPTHKLEGVCLGAWASFRYLLPRLTTSAQPMRHHESRAHTDGRRRGAARLPAAVGHHARPITAAAAAIRL